MTRKTHSMLVNGHAGITPEMAVSFQGLWPHPDSWLRMQVNYDLAQARRHASEIVIERLTPKVA